MAALRIGLGLLILGDLLSLLPDSSAFFTDEGVLPRTLLLSITHRTYLNFYLMAGTLWGVALLHLLLALSALALLVGYQTRWATLACWLLSMSLQYRNPLLLDAGHLELRLILFWCLFLPLGARASLDSMRSPQWAKLPHVYHSVAGLGYLWQVGTIYFWAAINKVHPTWIGDAHALYYVLNLDQFATPLAKLLRTHPPWMRSLSPAVVGLEFLVVVLLWCPWRNRITRKFGLLGIGLLHLSIAACLDLGWMVPTALICCCGLWPGAPLGWQALSRFGQPLLGWLNALLPLTAPSERPSGYAAKRSTQIFLVMAIGYVGYINLAVDRSWEVPRPVKLFGYTFQLYQSWPMFAPEPSRDDGWFVMEGVCENGRSVDLLRSGQETSWSKPDSVAALFGSQRWRMWQLGLRDKREAPLLQRYLEWSAQRWDAQHGPSQRLYYVRLVYVKETTPVPRQPFGLSSELMAERYCRKGESPSAHGQ